MRAAAAMLAAVHAAPARERVDVWQAPLDLGRQESGAALRTLSAEERVHAARLRFGAERWVAARAALRRVLGRCLDLAPERVSITAGANGKPRLVSAAAADLRFSLSHSGAVALVAVRLGHEVGVDLEQLRDDVDGAGIARALFGAGEHDATAVPAADAPRAFFRTWVRREALAKASGRGLIAPATDAEVARFTVRDLEGIAGFAAAVASEGGGWRVARVSA